MVGRLDGRRDKAIRYWVEYWEGDQDIETYSKPAHRMRSKGTGIRVLAHKRNRLPVAERRPKLVNATHKYVRFPGVVFIKGEGDRHEVEVKKIFDGMHAGTASIAMSSGR